MKEKIKELLLDFMEKDIEQGVPRMLKVVPVKGKATTIIGVRRSGKSTFMLQMIDKLRRDGTPKENIVYLNFFDDRLRNIITGAKFSGSFGAAGGIRREEGLDIVLQSYFSLFPEKRKKEKVHFFFDEIQTIDGWEYFIDRVLREEYCQVWLSGSSSKFLSKEIATSLRGRTLSWEMFPFSFREYLSYKNLDVKDKISSSLRIKLDNAFGEYFEKGGFPEVLPFEEEIRAKIHQEYFNSILFRDVVERYDISHPRAARDMAEFLLENISSLHSINRLHGFLKNLGHGVPKASVADYVRWFEDAFLFFFVKQYSSSLKVSNSNPKKVYSIDPSFVVSTSSSLRINSGHLLENYVMLSLRRISEEIFYYKTKDGKEIDFYIPRKGKKAALVQVCASLKEESTLKREIAALTKGMEETKNSRSLIISFDEEGKVGGEGKIISIMPAWKFFLDPSAALVQ